MIGKLIFGWNSARYGRSLLVKRLAFCFAAAVVTQLLTVANAQMLVRLPAIVDEQVFRIMGDLRVHEGLPDEFLAVQMSKPSKAQDRGYRSRSIGPVVLFPSMSVLADARIVVTSSAQRMEDQKAVLTTPGHRQVQLERVHARGEPIEISRVRDRFSSSEVRAFPNDGSRYLLGGIASDGPWIVGTTFGWPVVPNMDPKYVDDWRLGCVPNFLSYGLLGSGKDSRWSYLYLAESAPPKNENTQCRWPQPLASRVFFDSAYYAPRSQMLVLRGWGNPTPFAVVDAKDGAVVRTNVKVRVLDEGMWLRAREDILALNTMPPWADAEYGACLRRNFPVKHEADLRSLAESCKLAKLIKSYK